MMDRTRTVGILALVLCGILLVISPAFVRPVDLEKNAAELETRCKDLAAQVGKLEGCKKDMEIAIEEQKQKLEAENLKVKKEYEALSAKQAYQLQMLKIELVEYENLHKNDVGKEKQLSEKIEAKTADLEEITAQKQALEGMLESANAAHKTAEEKTALAIEQLNERVNGLVKKEWQLEHEKEILEGRLEAVSAEKGKVEEKKKKKEKRVGEAPSLKAEAQSPPKEDQYVMRHYKTMSQTVHDLGHVGRRIDIFKIDCEGCEWSTFEAWFGEGVDIRQIQVEMHSGTDGESPVIADRLLTHLRNLGYVVFHKESNTIGCMGSCIEYSFLKLSPAFQGVQDASAATAAIKSKDTACPILGGCQLAVNESFGFFDDVLDSSWKLQKQRDRETPNYCTGTFQCNPNGGAAEPRGWYQNNWEPTFTCQHERRLGGETPMGDGPKWICDPHRIDPDDCLVYSVGSCNNFQFEQGILRDVSSSCEVHTFDIKDYRADKAHYNGPEAVQFHAWGFDATSHSTLEKI